MKKLLYIPILFLLSCEKYVTEISDVTLSGKYVINRIDVTSVDQNTNSDTLYTLGSTFINHSMPHPFDSIEINRFYVAFDYSTISFNLLGVTQAGQDIWEYKNIFYSILNNHSFFYGYLQFDYLEPNNTPRRMIFLIEDDGFESLQLKSSGSWVYGDLGEKQVITLYMTRVGP